MKKRNKNKTVVRRHRESDMAENFGTAFSLAACTLLGKGYVIKCRGRGNVVIHAGQNKKELTRLKKFSNRR